MEITFTETLFKLLVRNSTKTVCDICCGMRDLCGPYLSVNVTNTLRLWLYSISQ